LCGLHTDRNKLRETTLSYWRSIQTEFNEYHLREDDLKTAPRRENVDTKVSDHNRRKEDKFARNSHGDHYRTERMKIN